MWLIKLLRGLTLSKKIVFIILIVCFCLIISLIYSFNINSTDSIEEQRATISKTILPSVCSGFITFLGLFITMRFNEYQIKIKEREKICPVLCLNSNDKASVQKSLSQVDHQKYIVCTDSKEIRIIKCQIQNSKDNAVNNLIIIKPCKDQASITRQCNKEYDFIFGVCSKKYLSFYLQYEDILGRRYKQKIKYKYDPQRNKYCFKSCDPKRRII